MKYDYFNRSEVKSVPSFHYYITIQYSAVTRTCYFREFYIKNDDIFTQHVFFHFCAWAWVKICCYGRQK